MRIIIMTLLALLAVNTALAATSPHYAIIIDAGSSGSRLHLFQYQRYQLPFAAMIPVIKDVFSEKTTPGLSSFQNHPAEAPASLKKLLDDAANELTKRHIEPGKVSISIMGTAGMRLLSDSDQQAIYNQINAYLKSHYAFHIKTIATISGKMEGVYGWLDINYLYKNFYSDRDITIGSIDMGGASTQIAFSTKENTKLHDVVRLQIAGHHYTVLSDSFLGLGHDQARNSINDNPLSIACYPTNYGLSSSQTGHFDFSTCKQIFTNIINEHHVKETLLAPSPRQHFVAYSAIYSVDHFLDVEKTPDQRTVEMRIQSVCSASWEQLKTQYPSIPEQYLSGYCANAVYDTDLLYDTYQLQGSQLTVINQINGRDIDWTLGALLFNLSNSDRN